MDENQKRSRNDDPQDEQRPNGEKTTGEHVEHNDSRLENSAPNQVEHHGTNGSKTSPKSYAWNGFWLTSSIAFLLFIFIIPMLSMFGEVAAIFYLYIGVTQLIYVIPLYIIGKSKGLPGFGVGITIAASLTFLLNASCFSMFM